MGKSYSLNVNLQYWFKDMYFINKENFFIFYFKNDVIKILLF